MKLRKLANAGSRLHPVKAASLVDCSRWKDFFSKVVRLSRNFYFCQGLGIAEHQESDPGMQLAASSW